MGDLRVAGRILRSRIADRIEVGMCHCLFGSQTFLNDAMLENREKLKMRYGITYGMVVFEQLVKEVNGLRANESLVVLVDKGMPGYPREL